MNFIWTRANLRAAVALAELAERDLRHERERANGHPLLPIIDIGHFKLERVRVAWRPEARDQVDLRVSWPARDATRPHETAESVTLSQERISLFHLEQMAETDYLPHLIRRTILKAFEHELDEWLRIDGKQLVDPHAHEKVLITSILPSPEKREGDAIG